MPDRPTSHSSEMPRAQSSADMIQELYSELRTLAAAKMARLRPGQTLQATALVHDAYLRLARNSDQRWENRAHFFASAAEAMRRVLVDQARKKNAQRRAGALHAETLDELQLPSPEPDDRILEVHEALEEFEKQNPGAAEVVKLRFFAGLNHEEVAALLDISEKTARRHWNLAKIWLFERISEKKSKGE